MAGLGLGLQLGVGRRCGRPARTLAPRTPAPGQVAGRGARVFFADDPTEPACLSELATAREVLGHGDIVGPEVDYLYTKARGPTPTATPPPTHDPTPTPARPYTLTLTLTLAYLYTKAVWKTRHADRLWLALGPYLLGWGAEDRYVDGPAATGGPRQWVPDARAGSHRIIP